MVPTGFYYLNPCVSLLLFLISLTVASACLTGAFAPDLTRVIVLPSWIHLARFAGSFAAEQHSYFRIVNSDLDTDKMTAIIPPTSTGVDHIGWMTRGTWDATVQTLRIQDDLQLPLKGNDVYTILFLEEMYGR